MERIVLFLQPFFSTMVLAIAGHSTNAGIRKKKGRMLLYLRKNLRFFSMKIATIPKTL